MKQLVTLSLFSIVTALSAQTTHLLTAIDFEFVPDSIFAAQGDSLHIVFGSTEHTFTQVSEETWNANGDTPSGGWNLGPGITETTIELFGTGTIHYICIPHATMGMKGIVHISLENAISERTALLQDRFYPNPTQGQHWLREASAGMLDLFFTDLGGREVLRAQVIGNKPVDVSMLPSGLYAVRAADSAGKEVFRQRIMRE
jgi:plastocyanin